MNPIWYGIIGLAIYLFLPKKQDAAAVAALSLPFKPAMKQPPDVEAFQKLLEVKQRLLDKGIPLAEVETMISDIVPHLTKEAA